MKTSSEMYHNVIKKSQNMKKRKKQQRLYFSILVVGVCCFYLLVPKNKNNPSSLPVIVHRTVNQTYFEESYVSPKNGKLYCTFGLKSAREEFQNQDVRFLVVVDVFTDQKQVNDKEKAKEYLRLLRKGIFFFHLEDDSYVCLLDEKTMQEFPIDKNHGYFLRFYDGDERYIQQFEKQLIKKLPLLVLLNDLLLGRVRFKKE